MMNPNEPNFGQFPAPPQPDQKSAGSTQQTQNPYDFIVNPAAAHKKRAIFKAQGPMRLLAIVGIISAVLLIVGLVAAQFLSGGGSTESLVSIAQQQQEIIRVAENTQRTSQDESTKGFAYTVALSIGSSQQQLQTYITKKGTKLDSKILALKRNADTDKLLDNAKATSTYDTTAQKVLDGLLKDYVDALKEVYQKTNSNELKEILRSNFKAAKTLLIQSENIAS